MKTGIRITTVFLVLCMMQGVVLAEGKRGKREGAFGQQKDRGFHEREEGREAFIGRLVTDKNLAEQIGLSQKQTEHIQDELYRVKLEMVDLQAALQKAAMEQARLLSAESIDEDAVMEAIEKTGKIRTKIAKLRIQPLILIKSSLDAEQLREARERMRKHHQKRREEMKERMNERRRKWGDRPGYGRDHGDRDKRPGNPRPPDDEKPEE